MDYLSVGQFARKHELSERTVRNRCAAWKIQGAFLTGKTWNVPIDAELPRRGKIKEMPLLKVLREEKSAKLKGGIYHRTQIDLTYNSNHIEGSRLTHDQTRYIFETHTLAAEKDGNLDVDDMIETVNHFRCIDFIIDNATEEKKLEDLIDFHQKFESIHPFQDGNGRVGRLILFKECLANGIVPFIITDDLKLGLIH